MTETLPPWTADWWKLAESAPLMQTVLVCNPAEGKLPVVAKRYADGWTNVGMVPVGLEKMQPKNWKIYDLVPPPTHWMPLPPGPRVWPQSA